MLHGVGAKLSHHHHHHHTAGRKGRSRLRQAHNLLALIESSTEPLSPLVLVVIKFWTKYFFDERISSFTPCFVCLRNCLSSVAPKTEPGSCSAGSAFYATAHVALSHPSCQPPVPCLGELNSSRGLSVCLQT